MSVNVLKDHGLCPGDFIECGGYAFGAKPRILVSAERHLEASVEGSAVDDRAAAFKTGCDVEALFHIGGEDTAAESELRLVGDLDGFIEGIKSDDRYDRPEDLHV